MIGHFETNADEVKDRISLTMTREFLDLWTKIQNNHDQELNRLKRIQGNSDVSEEDQELINNLLSLNDADNLQYQKDKLFIETGEDVEDIFIAFKYYKLI
jgi:hypothetical protein